MLSSWSSRCRNILSSEIVWHELLVLMSMGLSKPALLADFVVVLEHVQRLALACEVRSSLLRLLRGDEERMLKMSDLMLTVSSSLVFESESLSRMSISTQYKHSDGSTE